MPRRADDGSKPSWDALYETAAAQDGYFSLDQAREAGYSSQLPQYHLRAGRIERSLRAVFRLVHFPPSDHEDLVPVWLWSRREGVFGLETALAIHELSDVLPAHHDLLLPTTWASRRVRPPRGVRLHVADIDRTDWKSFGPVPVTTPIRTLRDCVTHHVQPDLLEQALDQALRRGLASRREIGKLRREAARDTRPLMRFARHSRPGSAGKRSRADSPSRACASSSWSIGSSPALRCPRASQRPRHVVDNDSRRVLAWTLERRLSAEGTRKILGDARQALADGTRSTS